MKRMGRDPQALKDMPRVPAGYGELLHHFNVLSKRRTYNLTGPNPIDFLSAFHYNQVIARLDLEFFLGVIDFLDEFYLKDDKKSEPDNKKPN